MTEKSNLDALSELSGIPKKEMDTIFKDIKENLSKLKECTEHNFNICLSTRPTETYAWECSNCGGRVSNKEKRWYELGRFHQSVEQNNITMEVQVIGEDLTDAEKQRLHEMGYSKISSTTKKAVFAKYNY